MSRVCEICGKKPSVGNNISHAHNLTKRRWLPNLKKVKVEENGRNTPRSSAPSASKPTRSRKLSDPF